MYVRTNHSSCNVARHIVDNKTDYWLQLISYVNKIDGKKIVFKSDFRVENTRARG